MKEAIVLTSGGLDSTTVTYRLIQQGIHVQPLFFDYGQHCVETEWNRLNEVLPDGCATPERINISEIFRDSKSRLINEANLWEDNIVDEDLYIPYRTMLFFAAAAARAQTMGILDVYTGFINSNHAKEIDCTANFMNKLDGLTESIGPVRFHSPFRFSSKSEVVKEATELNVPIGRTYSCQAASKFPCGACPNCVERLNALTS
ncbi:7-cyano-7-deazaguanine synthase [Vibrio parahaemolyticus]|uniref:7-cyano-7-deazaguanine synthase n=2 Tax=Vibrio parahaemolyticus TaxID=670 RepID=UPI000421FF08|nr:7-cyano-7-deazaguanine synthase [Vibrio parahaemolyticus]EJS4060301.1 7-cyano-7-deazaguanine synthase [Vibrio parahaemolyticus]EJV0276172.1 7-cyano-7-deazaguanine synthase [Vibrio parahaemolyticus]EKN4581093.1 7-cyano-7-deazaguanine synthase [Vibrio parahaemolyticus]MBE4150149.1 7-cyano-7-deazaguanine synthase [Vibrio parahaemolyticus]MBE4192264.1 7-cyano-7-deazaguanine synthase [Vibrio parahaemolyticus]